MGAPLYLDYAATTPLDGRVLDAMLPWMAASRPGNANARHHPHGHAAHKAVLAARDAVAQAIGVPSAHIVFTSGATESNALALRIACDDLRKTGRMHVITTMVEHKSILSTLDVLAQDGFTVTALPVQPCGMIEADMIAAAITPQTGLVVVQAVNNELGVIQPVDEIAAMLKGRGILLHVDAAQALGRIPVSADLWSADCISLSAHKCYGPQGVGALYVRDVRHLPVRPGTIPVALCAGFGAACDFLNDDRSALQTMRDDFISRLAPLAPIIHGHTDPVWNVPGILNLRFPGIDHETLVMALPDLSFGTGAACNDGPSAVITAIAGPQAACEAIRISFGRFTDPEELNTAADMMSAAIKTIKNIQEAA